MVAAEFGEALEQAEPLEAVDMDRHVASPPPNLFGAWFVGSTLDFFQIGRGKRREETIHEVKRTIAKSLPFQGVALSHIVQ